MRKDVYRKINSLRKKLDKSIEKTGLNSNETREISKEIDKLINEYEKSVKIVDFPQNSEIFLWYKQSYFELKKITKKNDKFPSIVEWNRYAKNNDLLNHASLEYISKLNWNYLRVKILREINMKI